MGYYTRRPTTEEIKRDIRIGHILMVLLLLTIIFCGTYTLCKTAGKQHPHTVKLTCIETQGDQNMIIYAVNEKNSDAYAGGAETFVTFYTANPLDKTNRAVFQDCLNAARKKNQDTLTMSFNEMVEMAAHEFTRKTGIQCALHGNPYEDGFEF